MLNRLTRFAFLSLVAVSSQCMSPMAYALPQVAGLVHLHPRAAMQPDVERVQLELYNDAPTYRGISVDGKTYVVQPRAWMTISAPEGTPVYAGDNVPSHPRGSMMFRLLREMNWARQPIR